MLIGPGGRAGLRKTVGAAAVRADANGDVSLTVRCGGATSAQLVNGRDPLVRIVSLHEAVNDEWEPIEIVGLPIDRPWGGTGYDDSLQGLVPRPD